MVLYGLTGGVGMGKSAVARLLAARGLKVVDTDHIARELVQPGEPVLKEIAAVFGPEIIRQDGSLDRGRLADLVFQDESQRKVLEGILHPRIRERWLAQTDAWRKCGERAGVVVVPLLYESNAENLVDKVICVSCTRKTQESRLNQRGWSPVQQAQRIEAQLSIAAKMDRADFVIWSESTLQLTERQLIRIFGLESSSAQ